jgi:hypothetical protein
MCSDLSAKRGIGSMEGEEIDTAPFSSNCLSTLSRRHCIRNVGEGVEKIHHAELLKEMSYIGLG